MLQIANADLYAEIIPIAISEKSGTGVHSQNRFGTRASVTLSRYIVGLTIGVSVSAGAAQLRPPTAEPRVVSLSGPFYAHVLTDANGRYVFTGLPPGRYNVGARKLGYFDGLLGDPSPRLGPSPISNGVGDITKRLILREDEWLLDATIALWRPGAIDGVVRDDRGEPVVGRYVRVLAARESRRDSRIASPHRPSEPVPHDGLRHGECARGIPVN